MRVLPLLEDGILCVRDEDDKDTRRGGADGEDDEGKVALRVMDEDDVVVVVDLNCKRRRSGIACLAVDDDRA